MSEILNLEGRTPEKLKNNKEEFNYFQSLNADLAICTTDNFVSKNILF